MATKESGVECRRCRATEKNTNDENKRKGDEKKRVKERQRGREREKERERWAQVGKTRRKEETRAKGRNFLKKQIVRQPPQSCTHRHAPANMEFLVVIMSLSVASFINSI